MKILLINPPWSREYGTDFGIAQPIGLAYIAAYLRKKNINVKILDALGEGLDKKTDSNLIGLSFGEIIKKIKKINPDLIGISSMFTTQYTVVEQLVNLIKKNKDIPIILGGAHPSSCPEEILGNKDIDYVVLGEGEETFYKLIKVLVSKNFKKIKQINGIAFRDKGKVVINPKTKFIKIIDKLPFPSRESLPLEKYFSFSGLKRGGYVEKITSIVTSRGCPFNCVFCAIHNVWGRGWRGRTPENVVEELKEIYNKHGITHVNIEDDNFTLDLERAKKILRLVRKTGIKFRFYVPNGIRADIFDEELLVLMKETGFKRLNIGIESGSQKVLDKIIGKKLDLKKVEQLVKLAKKHGLTTAGNFLLGFPRETFRDRLQSLLVAFRLLLAGMENAWFVFVMPYPATRLRQICEENDYLIDKDPANYDLNKPLIKADFSLLELKVIRLIGKSMSFLFSLRNSEYRNHVIKKVLGRL